MKKIIQLQGLDCAACAAELERKLTAVDGVVSASIAFVSQKLTLEYETEESLQKALACANAFEDVRVVNEKEGGMSAPKALKLSVFANKKRLLQWVRILLSAVFLTVGAVCKGVSRSLTTQVVCYVCFGIAYLSVGYAILWATVKNLFKGRFFDENFLMSVASVGAIVLGEYVESVLVLLLYQVGETLQESAVESSRNSLSALMQLKSESATVFRGKEQVSVPPEEIAVGEILLVKAGEKVPVDGVLIDRTATLDRKSLTGESAPCAVESGAELLSGSINVGGTFTMRALRPYKDSAVQKILDMVENASSGKAAPEKFITKFARWYTPVVCCLALLIAFAVPLFSGRILENQWYFKDVERWVQTTLTFLVISCPCALVISVPLTYFSGIGACARQGILVKGATYLDTLAHVQTIAFDKTGTLTEGVFSIRARYPEKGVEGDTLLAIAAAVEKNSAHPIAKAFARLQTSLWVENVVERAGRGLMASVGGETVLVGNAQWLQENGVTTSEKQSAYTLVYVAKGGRYLGCIEVGDSLRAEAKEVLAQLKKEGITRQVMLTGDAENRARTIAEETGVTETHATLLPLDKLQKAERLKTTGALAYVGDGINDAPVMTVADCSFSMGKLGSAAAVEASDFVLITDDLRGLPQAVKIAKKTRKIVTENILFSIAAKVAFMALGVCGVLPLWAAVFADVGIMLLAVCNSFRVRGKKELQSRKNMV